MTTMFRFYAVLAATAAALLVMVPMGCDKKGGGGAGASSGAGEEGGSGGLETEHRSFTLGGLKLEVDVPKGWTEQKMGETTILFTAPTGAGMYKSMMRVGATCQGDCASIPDNLKGAAKAQVESHGSSFGAITVATDEAVGAGRRFQLDFEASGKPAHQVDVYAYEAGWPEAGLCSLMVYGDDAGRVADFAKLCEGMTVTKTGG